MGTEQDLQARIRTLTLRIQTLTKQLSIARDKDRQLTRLIDALYQSLPGHTWCEPAVCRNQFDGLSVVIAAYNIPRQLQRTLLSCSPTYQQFDPERLEIIVVDNGSTVPLQKSDFARFPNIKQIIRIERKPSPVFGLNEGMARARFSTIALMIDGAHLLTPGIFNHVRSLVALMPRPVINVPQYILGPASQNLRSADNAFEREAEDLRTLGWPQHGYTLFDYAVMAGENPHRAPLDAIESNCLVTTRAVLDDCGGFDERFDETGAGLANIEIFNRLCHDPRNEYITLLGEGTFHQNHGGTTTSLTPEERDELVQRYYEKYKAVTGNERNFNMRGPFVYGPVSNGNRFVPVISREFGQARAKILQQLADIYVQRARYGQTGEIPSLTLRPSSSEERRVWPTLPPRGLPGSRGPARYGYRSILKTIHEVIRPRLYLEIGVDNGESLNLAQCPRIGVDSAADISVSLLEPTRIFRMTSDQFFADERRCARLFADGCDMAFVDGMHLCENVLRDFMNVERWVSRNGVVVLDDVYPEQLAMADRDRQFNAWSGDVFKIIPVLRRYRPDLRLHVFEAFIGPYRKGLALVAGLDPESQVLRTHYDQIRLDMLGDTYSISSIEDLERMVPITPIDDLVPVLRSLRPTG
jgi:glycosyltransferase involved in cell wall biosynthesis